MTGASVGKQMPYCVFLRFRDVLVNVACIGALRKTRYFKSLGSPESTEVVRVTLSNDPKYFEVNAPFEQFVAFLADAMASGPGIYDAEKAFPPAEEKQS